MSSNLYLEVKNAEKVLFQGYVNSFSSTNESGLFDILPYHANFFSIIKGKIVINNERDKKEIDIVDTGILKAMKNRIDVFLGIST